MGGPDTESLSLKLPTQGLLSTTPLLRPVTTTALNTHTTLALLPMPNGLAFDFMFRLEVPAPNHTPSYT